MTSFLSLQTNISQAVEGGGEGIGNVSGVLEILYCSIEKEYLNTSAELNTKKLIKTITQVYEGLLLGNGESHPK